MEVLEEVEEEEVVAMAVVKEVEEDGLGLMEEDQALLGLELEVEMVYFHQLEVKRLFWC